MAALVRPHYPHPSVPPFRGTWSRLAARPFFLPSAANFPQGMLVFIQVEHKSSRENVHSRTAIQRHARLLKNDTTTKLDIAKKRLKAGWNVDYLGRLLRLNS